MDAEQHRDRLLGIFKKLDIDGSGQIQASEVRTALRDFGIEASKRDAQRMLRSIDLNRDGSVSFSEFAACLEHSEIDNLKELLELWKGAPDTSDNACVQRVPGLAFWQTALAGSLGALASRTATAPLERVKIQAQTGGERHMGAALRAILAREGVHGLFAGNAANCLRAVPTGAIVCTAYTRLVAATGAHEQEHEALFFLGCAGAAATMGNTVTYPLDVVRTRLTVPDAMGGQARRSITETIRATAAIEGPRAFYRGLTPTILAVAPYVALQNTTIDEAKDLASSLGIPATPSLFIGAGVVAGLCATTVTFPLDVLRRRMQLPKDARGELHGNVFAASRALFRQGGAIAFFRGMAPAYCKAVPAAAVQTLVQCGLIGHFKAQAKVQQG